MTEEGKTVTQTAGQIAQKVLKEQGLIGLLLLVLIASNITERWFYAGSRARSEERQAAAMEQIATMERTETETLNKQRQALITTQERLAAAAEEMLKDEKRETELLKLFMQRLTCEEINPALDDRVLPTF